MKWTTHYQNKSVLVTGGSSGIGLALSNRLFELGASVFILARRPDQLEVARKEIETHRVNSQQKIGILEGSVANLEQITELLHDFIHRNGTPDLLINSAGITHPVEFVNTPIEIFRAMMDVNFFGIVHTTKILAPLMIERGSGHIINISSAAAIVGAYGYTAYAASKYAVRGFTDTLRAELKPLGVRCSLVLPADVNTPQLEYETPIKPFVTREFSKTAKVIQPEYVAKVVLRAAARGKYLIIPGADTHLLYHVTNLMGAKTQTILVDSIIASAFRRKNQS